MKAIRIESVICEGQERLDTADGRREVRVTVIRGGASINGYYYGEPALRAIAALIENAHAYVDHARSELIRRYVRYAIWWAFITRRSMCRTTPVEGAWMRHCTFWSPPIGSGA